MNVRSLLLIIVYFKSLVLQACCEKVLLHLNALEYDGNVEVDNEVDQTSCVEGAPEDMDPEAPDAQTTIYDEECRTLGRCHLSMTLPGESVSYLFFQQDFVDFTTGTEQDILTVDIAIRVAAFENSTQSIELQAYDSNGQDAGLPKLFSIHGNGFQEFKEYTWQGVKMNTTSNYYEIVVHFVDGRVNLCSIKVTLSEDGPSFPDSNELGAVSIEVVDNSKNESSSNVSSSIAPQLPPTTWSALEYSSHDDIELILPLNQIDNECNLRKDGVHAKPIRDQVCIDRDSSPCAVAFTEPDEFLSYRFDVPTNSSGLLDFRVRASASHAGKRIRFEVRNATANATVVLAGKRFEVPHGDGSWDIYSDIVWKSQFLISGEYVLDVRFLTGHVNVCSVSVLGSEPIRTDDDLKLQVPGIYSALNYYDYHDISPDTSKEKCHDGLEIGMDTQMVNDPVCDSAISFVDGDITCTVAFTDREESLTYLLLTNDATRSIIDLSFRVASHDPNRRFLVEIDPLFGGESKEFFSPGLGFHTYDSIEWKGIAVETSGVSELRVTFLDGRINFCALQVQWSRSEIE